MKKIFRFLCLVLICLSLSGCIRMHYNFDIHKDKSMDMSITFAMINDAEEGTQVDTDDQIVKNLEAHGWKVEAYIDEEGKYEGNTMTLHIDNIDTVTSNTPIEVDLYEYFDQVDEEHNYEIGKLFYKSGESYIANWVLSRDLEERVDEKFDEVSDEEIYQMVDFKVDVNLPNQAIEENSVVENSNHLSWDLKDGTRVNFVFRIQQGISLITILSIAILIGLCIAVAFMFKINSKLEKEYPNVLKNVEHEPAFSDEEIIQK